MEPIEELCRQVETLGREHRAAPFPRKIYENERVNGTSLVMLDANIAGCISTFLACGNTLDLRRTAVLGASYRAVALVLVSPDLTEEARPYYARLETLAGLVLAIVGCKPKKADDN